MSKSRKYILSLLLLPVLAGTVFLSSLNSDSRRGFLADYGSNLGRLVRGQWEFAELRDPARQNTVRHGRNDFRRWDGGFGSTDQIFAKLDVDDDDLLSAEEMGQRVASRSDSDEPINAQAFQQILMQRWSPVARSELNSRSVTSESVADSPETSESIADQSAATESVSSPPAADPNRSDVQAPIKLTAENLLDPHHVMVVNVELSEEDWRALCNQSRSHQTARENPLAKPYTNFRGSVTVNGVRIDDVAIRKKGFIGSQDTVRPSLKIKFDEYVDQAPIEGLDRLTLNNNKQDRALVSQAMTYFLFRKAGIPAPRASYAAVSVNGRYLGVYTHVESVKKPFLRRVYGADDGRLYEGTLTDFHPKATEWMEPKTAGSAEDFSLITRLAETLADDAATLDDIAALVDIDVYLKYWSIESLINFWDGYSQNQNNYFVSEDPRNGLIYFIPWGADSCFGGRPHFVQRRGEHSEAVRATGILANRLYHIEGIPERYRAAMLGVLENAWDEQELLAEIDRIELLLRDHVDINQIGAIVWSDSVRDFIKNRRATILSELTNHWPAQVAAQPRIPQYRETVGQAQGTFTRGEGDRFILKATMTLDEEPVDLEYVQVAGHTIELAAVEGDESTELRLVWNESSRNDDGSYPLSGEITYPYRRNHDVKGTVALTKDDQGQIQQGQFKFTVRERRGGRW